MNRTNRKYRGGRKLVFAIFAFLVTAGLAWAQGDDPRSYQYGEDSTCNDFPNNCEADHGCVDVDFSPEASGDYNLCAWVTCGSTTTCTHCAACVRVWRIAGGQFFFVAECSTDDEDHCGSGGCSNACTVNLRLGQNYRLSVCHVFCSANDDNCEQACDYARCTAHGKITRDPCP